MYIYLLLRLLCF